MTHVLRLLDLLTEAALNNDPGEFAFVPPAMLPAVLAEVARQVALREPAEVLRRRREEAASTPGP